MRMKCRRYIKDLCLCADDLLDRETAEKVRAHVASCAECSQFLLRLEKSRKITDALRINNSASDYLAGQQMESIVDRMAHTIIPEKKPALFSGSHTGMTPRIAFATAFALVLILAGLFTIRFHPSRTGTVPHAFLLTPDETMGNSLDFVPDSLQDGFLRVNDGCLLKPVRAHFEIISVTPRNADIKLLSGELLVECLPGAYDTIRFFCQSLVIQPYGTRFSLTAGNDSLAVNIIEGAVFITEHPSRERVTLHAGKMAVASREHPLAVHDMTPAGIERLETLFCSVFNEEPKRRDCMTAPGTVITRTHDFTVNKRNDADTLYGTALKLYQNGMLHATLEILKRYNRLPHARLSDSYMLMADSHNRLKQYKSAYRFYMKAAHDDTYPEAETALHIANRLLLSRLSDNDKAKQNILRYLERYPNGRYRQLERQYLIQVYYRQGQRDEMTEIILMFIRDYPRSCQSLRYKKFLDMNCPM